MYSKFALRDAGIIAAAVALWFGVADASRGSDLWSDLAGFTAGIGLGAAAYLIHEWGHFLGGIAVGAHFRAPTSLASASLFTFESSRSTRPQFLVMSIGGFVATAAVLAAYYLFLPDGLLATRIARGSVAFGSSKGASSRVALGGSDMRTPFAPLLAAIVLAAPSALGQDWFSCFCARQRTL